MWVLLHYIAQACPYVHAEIQGSVVNWRIAGRAVYSTTSECTQVGNWHHLLRVHAMRRCVRLVIEPCNNAVLPRVWM